MSEPQRLRVVVSYSHRDAAWLERVQVHLRPLTREGTVDLWSDTRIKPGSEWRDDIARALKDANVAILLVSADFLASDFIAENELPPILNAAIERGTTVIPVVVNHCLFAQHAYLSKYQAINAPDYPLASMPSHEAEAAWLRLSLAVRECVESSVPADAGAGSKSDDDKAILALISEGFRIRADALRVSGTDRGH